MADSELIIKIAGDADDFNAALEDAKKQTENLENQLQDIAAISGVAFAALTAEVYLTVRAFGVQQKAMAEMDTALQNQGIYTEELAESYRAWGEEIEKKTGIDSDAITSAQALAQSYLGETKLTEELTKSVVDLSVAKKIDLGSAFELVAKGISTNSAGLKKLGIDIDDSATKEERLAQVTEKLTQKFGGQAEASAKTGAGLILLESAFGNLQKELGSRLEPILSVVVSKFTDLINTIKDNKYLLDLITSFGLAALAVTGIVTGVAAAGVAFLKLKAVMQAAQLTMTSMGLTMRALMGATGIGLLVLLLAEVYLNWESLWPRMQAIFVTFVNNIKGLLFGIGRLLVSVFVTRNLSDIKASLGDIQDIFKKGFQEYGALVDKKLADQKESEKKQIESKKDAAKQEQKIVKENEDRKNAVIKASNDLAVAEAQGQSKAILDIKKAELALLKQIAEEENASIRGELYAHLEELRIIEADAIIQDQEQKRIAKEQLLALDQEYNELSQSEQRVFDLTMSDSLTQQIQTESQVRLAAFNKKVQDQIKQNNEYLLNEKKFGKSYADLHKFMNSEQVKGAAAAAGELSALQGSSNSTLFAIGKAAAIANVSVKTAESAMNIYAGFSTIPFVGQALGIAGAAAAVAFGGEQIRRIASTPKPVRAADGGLITGGTAGKDSVPALLMPNELVVPARNFEEVVNAVSSARSGSSAGGMIELSIKLQDNLMDFIEMKLVERQNLNLSIQGA